MSQWSVPHLLELCSGRPPDDEAWKEFVRRYHSTIRINVIKTFHRKAKEESDRKPQFPEDLVEDLVQAVYIRLVEDRNRALERFEGEHENSIFQYLGMIAINVVRDYFRETRAQKRPKISVSLDELLEMGGDSALLDESMSALWKPTSGASGSALTQEEIDIALRRAVKGKNRDRDLLIFKLKFYEGLTLDEITQSMRLDISAVSVGSIINRIIKKLRVTLSRHGKAG
ncbi:MAG TPA: sigma-70 family RNA polymerase sigma factor [Blastocatellia bacterium]|nr:sigma-70 family RNA polymerase sigma factor [Blastocatellia bacterium]